MAGRKTRDISQSVILIAPVHWLEIRSSPGFQRDRRAEDSADCSNIVRAHTPLAFLKESGNRDPAEVTQMPVRSCSII